VNWFDIFLIALAVGMGIGGAMQGFARQAIGLAALILSVFLAAWFYGVAAAFFSPYVSSKSIANVVGFFVVLALVNIVGALAGWGASKVFKWSGLSWLDRLLGGGFGLLKAGLIAVAFVMILVAFPMKAVPASVAESRAAPYLIEASHVLVHLAPKEMKDGFQETYDRLMKLWDESAPDQLKKKALEQTSG
jgi:membrane protein required for colicin V production